MECSARNYLLFKTHLFVFNQNDRDIDRWLVGGDCAGWFYARLLPIDPILRYTEPVMEDWGWTFGVSVDDVQVRLNLWAYSIEDCWLFGLEVKNRFFRRHSLEALARGEKTVSGALEGIVASDPRILKHAWFAENPFDLQVAEF